MIRIGLMGCGAVANYGHLPVIGKTPGLSLVSLFDPDEKRLRDAQKKFDVANGFTDPILFFESGIDAVAITSPAPVHFENVLMAARFGKHVLCEKPLAMTEADGQAMIDAMRTAGKQLFVGFDYRFSPVALKIKQLIDEGAIGKKLDLRLIYLWNLHGKFDANDPTGLQQRRVLRMQEGGPIVDCGVHQIDLARWWLGSEVIQQTSHGIWLDDYESPDHLYLHMTHANGAHTLVEMSYSYTHTAKDARSAFTYEIIGDKGLIRYDREAKTFELRTPTGTTKLNFSPEKNFAGMYEEFVRAIESRNPGVMPTGADGLIATRIARRAVDDAIANRA